MDELIYPLLDKLSIAWMTGSFLDVHESFVTQIIKSKIYTAIESIEEDANAEPCYLIYLQPKEKQELSLLYLHFILKSKGCKVINLGGEVNINDLRYSIESCSPHYVFTILNEEIENMPLQQYLNEITDNIGSTKLLLTGYQTLTPGITWPENSIILNNLEDTLDFVESSVKVN